MNNRIGYIDCIRGFAILMVVYHHVAIMGLRKMYTSDVVDGVIVSFFMPLFFFVSGIFAKRNFASCKEITNHLIRKFKDLVIPFFSIFTIAVLYYSLDFKFWMLTDYKSGFWFTLVLFQIVVIFTFTRFVLSTLLRTNPILTDTFIFVFGCCLYLIAPMFSGEKKGLLHSFPHLFSLTFTLKYFVFYVLGNVYRTYNLQRFLNGKLVAGLVLMANFTPPISVIPNSAYYFLLALVRIMFIFILFEKYCSSASRGFTLVERQLSLLGRRTQEIYFIHYFLLFSMPHVALLLNSQTLYCFRGIGANWLLELLVLLPITILIAYFSVFIRKIFDISPSISSLIFGLRHD